MSLLHSDPQQLRRILVAALIAGMTFPELAAAAEDDADESMTTDPVVVTDDEAEKKQYEADRAESATKTNVPIGKTPRSVSVATSDRIEDQGNSDLADTLQYMPGIFSPAMGGGDLPAGDYFFIRGFNATDWGYGLHRDGLRVQPNRYDSTTELYGVEQVEVFRGPTSILYGQNAPGGIVNLVSKRPTARPLHEIKASYGSFDQKRLATDHSGSLSEDGNILGRVVLLGQEGGSQIDDVPNDRFYLAPSVTFLLDDATTLTLLAHYQYDNTEIQLGLPWEGTILDNPNGQLDNDTSLGHPDWDKFERHVWSVGGELEHVFNSTWQLTNKVRYQRSRNERREFWWGELAADNETVTNNTAYDRRNWSHMLVMDNQLQADFEGAGMDHTALLGASLEATGFEQDWTRSRPPLAPFGLGSGVQDVNIYDPDWQGEPDADEVDLADTKRHQQTYGLYTQLHSERDGLITLLGARYDWVNSHYDREPFEYSYNGTVVQSEEGQELDYWNQAFTWQAGLMYQFDFGLSPYASYATGFQPVQGRSEGAGDYGSGDPFDPIESEQSEVGVKYTPPGWDTTATLSLYELTRTNDIVGSGLNAEQVGESRSRGVEVEVVSDLTANLHAVLSYTYTDAEIVDDGGSEKEGDQKNNVPYHSGALWLSHRVANGTLAGLRSGAGARYIGSIYAENSEYGRVKSDPATLVDAGVGYDIDNWSMDLKVKNLFDREYYTNCVDYGRCNFGKAREVTATVGYNW